MSAVVASGPSSLKAQKRDDEPGDKAVMWFSVVFAAAIELVAGFGLAFVQMDHRAQWRIPQRELDEVC